MRNFKYIILSLGLIAFMLSSCNKENQNQIVQNTDEEVAWTKEDLRIQNNILGFQDKIKNNNFKNGETIELDSAIWYMEAGINFSYCKIDTTIIDEIIDTFFVELQMSEGEVLISSIQESYQQVEDEILQGIYNMNNKRLRIGIDPSPIY
jgi:hypothetical protein